MPDYGLARLHLQGLESKPTQGEKAWRRDYREGMVNASQQPVGRQPWARRAIGVLTGQDLPERDWKARGGNISLLASGRRTGLPADDVIGDETGVSEASVDKISELLGFLTRPIAGLHPYLFLETMEVPVRTEGRVRPATAVMAIGVRASGHREVLGADVADELNVTFWLEFLRGLRSRGLEGVRLVTADDHAGLQLALRAVLPAAAWQRCLTHFVRRSVEAVPMSARPFATAMLRNVFGQPDPEAARRAIDRISLRIGRRNPRLAELLRQADPASLTYYIFPAEHRRQIWSTNAERLLAKLARRCDRVGTFPGRRAVLRVVAGVLQQQDAEWRAAGPYCKPVAEAVHPAIRRISLGTPREALVGAAW